MLVGARYEEVRQATLSRRRLSPELQSNPILATRKSGLDAGGC
ncbi:hypothetical protein [Liquorilactobacillus satsumensis]|nr:hypothetical protein [Liquorilactobacillus satsumensis]